MHKCESYLGVQSCKQEYGIINCHYKKFHLEEPIIGQVLHTDSETILANRTDIQEALDTVSIRSLARRFGMTEISNSSEVASAGFC